MANPLTLVIPLKEGIDLGQLQAGLAQLMPNIGAAMEAVGTVHYSRVALLDHSSPNLQPKPDSSGPFSFAVITTYDGAFDVYIQDFVTHLGPIYDTLLGFSADGAGIVPVADHVEEFTSYLEANDLSKQPPSNAFPFYNAYPFTVQQVLANAPS
jgi:hypothetical protein